MRNETKETTTYLNKFIQVGLMVLRAVRGSSQERVPDAHLLGLGHHSPQELVMDTLLHEESSGCDAVLAFVEKY